MGTLSEDLILGLCSKPCKRGPITTSQHRLMPDGTVDVTGARPPVLCDACPKRGADGPPLHLAVLFDFPATGDVWELAGIERGAGTAIVRVVFDG
jgi:hypothetical protein